MKHWHLFGLLVVLVLAPIACIKSSSSPTGAAGPVPMAFSGLDITNFIDSGKAITGDTTGKPDNYQEYTDGYNYGAGVPDIAFKFHVDHPKRIYFNFCGSSFDQVAYIRSAAGDETTTLSFDDDSSCVSDDVNSWLVSTLLQPGDYYLILDGYEPGEYGTFTFVANTFVPDSAPGIPANNPIEAVQPAYSFGTATDMGILTTGAWKTGHGVIWDYSNDNDDYYKFTPSASGTVNLTIDNYTNAAWTSEVTAGFDVYDQNHSWIGGTGSNGSTESTSVSVNAGQPYYVDVWNDNGTVDYRLSVQGPAK